MSVQTSTAKARILVVEDDTVVARDLCRRIERLGYHIVDVCHSSERALHVAQQERPDRLLMDVSLNGVDVVRAAMEIRRSVEVPMLLLAAHSDRGRLNRVKQANPNGFVLKPVQQRDLMVAIEFALHRAARRSCWSKTMRRCAKSRGQRFGTEVIESSSPRHPARPRGSRRITKTRFTWWSPTSC